jgi:hypothetical protein
MSGILQPRKRRTAGLRPIRKTGPNQLINQNDSQTQGPQPVRQQSWGADRPRPRWPLHDSRKVAGKSGSCGLSGYRTIRSARQAASVAWLSPSPPAWLAGPKSKMQFNGVGGLRTYISIGTFFAAASGASRAVSNGPSKQSGIRKTESRDTDRPLSAGPVPYRERRRNGKFESLFGRS